MIIITVQDIIAFSTLVVLGVIFCVQYLMFKIKGK